MNASERIPRGKGNRGKRRREERGKRKKEVVCQRKAIAFLVCVNCISEGGDEVGMGNVYHSFRDFPSFCHTTKNMQARG